MIKKFVRFMLALLSIPIVFCLLIPFFIFMEWLTETNDKLEKDVMKDLYNWLTFKEI